MEIIITLVIFGSALYIFIKNWRKTAKGECNCDGCDTSCSMYDDKDAGKIAFVKKKPGNLPSYKST